MIPLICDKLQTTLSDYIQPRSFNQLNLEKKIKSLRFVSIKKQRIFKQQDSFSNKRRKYRISKIKSIFLRKNNLFIQRYSYSSQRKKVYCGIFIFQFEEQQKIESKSTKQQKFHNKLKDQFFIKETFNTLKRGFSQHSNCKQEKNYVKSLLNKNKDNLLGGGSCCTKQVINESNFHEIFVDETQNNNNQNNEFINEYKKWTDKETIKLNIEQDTQLKIQKNLLKNCIIDNIIQQNYQINIYSTEIQEIFETYLMIEVTRVSNKFNQQQETITIEEIFQEVKTIEQYEQDFPIMELVFYTEILADLNKVNHKFDESEEKEIIKRKRLINAILNFTKNEDFSSIISSANETEQNIHMLDKKKQLFPLKYQVEIWLRKIKQFQDKFMMISYEEEILFYVNFFFEMNKKQNQQNYTILTLIRMNFILEKFQKEKSQLKNVAQIYQQFSDFLIKANINEFLNELMQNQDKYTNKLFLIFSIENQYYRYITFNILLNFYSIFTIIPFNIQNQEYLLEFLCNKYLTEKQLSIRVIFEKNHQFVKYFNDNIKLESFKQKMIAFDKQRKGKLQPYVISLKDHERSISSFDDIIKLISENAIQKWERDIKKRQRLNIAQKDDVLLEVRDLYINQMITYLNGNPIFKKSKKNNREDNENSIQQQNAIQDILNLFLSHDYSNKLNFANKKSGKQQDDDEIQNQLKQCQILGILAEGGTGKSMLIKKLETLLIEKLTKLNAETETGNYLPILVKCNSLDQKYPSLDEYLKQQGINEDMLNSLKQNERNKLILLDGYDEYTGDYFQIYSTLKIKEWKNTKIIVATRKEKLTENEACLYFSKQNEDGEVDNMSFTLVRLEEFTSKDIHEYVDRYFKQERKNDINLIEKDLKNLRDCLINVELEKILHLPINLYLFSRMLINLDDKQIQNLKSKVSDQISIQEIFFSDQFEREAQSFIDSYISSVNLKIDKKFKTSIKNCYFEYFQTIAMQMFRNRGVIQGNYLQVERQNINFNISQSVDQILQKSQTISLLDKIKNYINSKIITRVKSEQQQNIKTLSEKQQEFIEFKHKSLYEYFVARAMKNDFDIHGENVYKLNMEELEQFKINQKCIMNIGVNQSEQQVLIKLYKLIKDQIDSQDFCSNYHEKLIEKNNRFIQYLKRSKISTNSDLSQIDIGASNLISALFVSKFSFPKLNLSLCSFSKAYICTPKSDEVNFDRCNIDHAFLQNTCINFDSCNTQSASFDGFQKAFDINEIYFFNKVIWGKNNLLYSISQSGFINVFKITNEGFSVLKSKKISHSPLLQIQFENENHFLVSSKYTLFQISITSFDIFQSYKFTYPITNISQIEESILVVLDNQTVFKGTFKDGFQQLNNIGCIKGSIYNQINQILVTYQDESFSLWNTKKNLEFIKTIQEQDGYVKSVAFSPDGKYIAIGDAKLYNGACKILNTQKNFEFINLIKKGGHSGINSIAFSVDGKYFVTGSDDGACKIWNVERGFEFSNTIQGPQWIKSIAFSEDGKYFATAGDRCCQIWNAEKGFEFTNSIQGGHAGIRSVAFSADGKFFATGSYDYYQYNQRITKDINSISFSQDGKYLATGSSDTTCKLWSAERDFELIYTLKLGPISFVTSIAFSADGRYLATGSYSRECRIWDVEKGSEIINLSSHTDEVLCVAFSANGKYLATGSKDDTCIIWNPEKEFKIIQTIYGHDEGIYSVAFSADGKYLVTGSQDETCKIWNAQKNFKIIKTIQGHTSYIRSVAFSGDGKYLATGSDDRSCKIWDIDKGFELINTIEVTDHILSVAFSADNKLLATDCKIWNVEKGYEIIKSIQGHTNDIRSVAFSPDGKYLVSGSDDKSFKIWNVEKGFELINTVQGHTDSILTVTFSADTKYLATGSQDCTCKIWNVQKDFEIIKTINEEHTSKILFVAFSDDGKYLVTSSCETCKIWNVKKDFELINEIYIHDEPILQVAFTKDVKYLATGSKDMTCKVWNVEQGFELINATIEHDDSINSVVFSPDGKYLITGSSDATCKVWNVEQGFELTNIIQGHTDSILSATFSADGMYLTTFSQDSTCKIWNTEQGFEQINTIKGKTDSTYVAFSGIGKYLATTNYERTCKIWDVENFYQSEINFEQNIAQSQMKIPKYII